MYFATLRGSTDHVPKRVIGLRPQGYPGLEDWLLKRRSLVWLGDQTGEFGQTEAVKIVVHVGEDQRDESPELIQTTVRFVFLNRVRHFP